MYNGTPRDHGDKKRQRLTNELWMEAIMNKGKTPEGFTSTSTLTSRAVPTTVTSPAVEREGRLNVTPTWDAPTPQTSMAQQQYATGYQERPTERVQNRFQGRETESFSRPVRGMPMETVSPHQKRMVNASGTPGYAVRADAVAGYHGRAADTSSPFPQRKVKPSTVDYLARPMNGATVDQRRPVDEAVADQYRMRDGAASECQGKPANEPADHQERTSGIAYEPGKFGQDPTSYQSGMHQGRVTGGKLGKMAEDYKKDRKLPSRVEEMLREQVNLDGSALHDAFAVAMEDLILEHEANFVAKGVCHLCVSKVYLPVVNFCPHADENHSLCREHLRSVYRVRMEALFVGRNGSAPNRRLLRCLVCTRGCPCSLCRAEKEKDIRNYKRYLLDTLRRCGHGTESAVRDDQTTAAIAIPAPEQRSTFGVAQNLGKTDGRRYTQYVPTPLLKICSSVQDDGFPARGSLTEAADEACSPMETQQSESNRCQVRGQYGRDGCVSNAEVSSMPVSSTHASSLQISSMQTTGLPASGTPKSSAQVSGIHTPQLHSTQHFFISTSDASSMPPSDVSVTANGEQGTGRRAAARAAPSRIHQRSMKSPTAATLLNCAESEKSLVQLLSSLNQGRAPANSVAADVQSVDSSYRQNISGYSANGKAAESGRSGGPGNTKAEASFRVDSGRGILDNDYQPERLSRDQASVSSTAAVNSSPRDRSSVDDRSTEVSKLRKRKSGDNDAENGLTARGLPNMASRDALRAVYRDDSATSQQHVAGQRQQQTGTRPSLKPGDCDKDTASRVELKKNHSSQRLPPAQHRRPGRPRKSPSDGTAATVLTLQTERKGHQDRRSTTPVKRGRGRPPKRGKRAKGNDEETTGDNYNEEQEEGDGKDEDGAESELDANLDYCEVCEGPGDLVCCDKCPRSFHLKCLHMTETDLPEGDWQCSECKRPSRFDAYSVTVASEKTMQNKCLKIVQCLKSHPFSKQFLSPVENIPMYTRVVKQPMDLSTIENKLKKGAYVLDGNTLANGVEELDVTHFADDVRLMWSNCKVFNDDGSGITRAADILSAGFERLYKESTAPPLTAQDGC